MRETTARDYAAKHCSNPCYGCTARKVGCHAKCDKYEAYRLEYKQVTNDMFQTQKTQNLANDFAFESRLKHKTMLQTNKRRRSK
jgi:hypothetical protein